MDLDANFIPTISVRHTGGGAIIFEYKSLAIPQENANIFWIKDKLQFHGNVTSVSHMVHEDAMKNHSVMVVVEVKTRYNFTPDAKL